MTSAQAPRLTRRWGPPLKASTWSHDLHLLEDLKAGFPDGQPFELALRGVGGQAPFAGR
ncbi:MAG: hypothetical protein LC797_10155 [Chloroflexi bacterium]|nr:hypothetical protein [Chloroflexota bacterium]